MSALLFTENIYAKSHKGFLLKYEQLFVKTGKMPRNTSIWIRTTFSLRQEADYDLDASITEEESVLIIS